MYSAVTIHGARPWEGQWFRGVGVLRTALFKGAPSSGEGRGRQKPPFQFVYFEVFDPIFHVLVLY